MPINNSELLSRFIFSKNHIRANGSAKPGAFLPRGDTNKTSVYRIDSLNKNDIWAIGRSIADARDKTLKGRADITAIKVSEQTLDVIESEPPPQHADIIGWPIDQAERKQKALDLSEASLGHKL